MKIATIIIILFCFNPTERLLDFDEVEIIGDSTRDDVKFLPNNLDRLWEMTDRATLGLKLATCPLEHTDEEMVYDELTDEDRFQHVIAVALDDSNLIIPTKVALPCPPHCGGGGGQLQSTATTIADYISGH